MDAIAEEHDDETPREIPMEPTDDDILSNYVTGGIVSTFQGAATREQERSIKQIIRLVEGCKVVLLDKTKVAREAQSRLDHEEAKLGELEAESDELSQRMREIRGSRLLNVTKKKRMAECSDRMRVLKSQIELQAEAVYKETQIRDYANRERDVADMELHKLRDKLLLFEQVDSKLAQQDKVVADYRVKQEKLAIERARRRHRQQKKHVESVRRAQEAKARTMAATAISLNKKATKRVAADRAAWREMEEQGRKIAAESRVQRAEAILELKRNTDKAMSELQGANERHQRAEAKIAARNDKEFQALLEDGENPYEVFRRRRRDKDVKRQRARQIRKVKETEMHIASRMIDEAKRERKEAEQRRKDAEYEEVYQKEMGRTAKEARVSRFISRRTKGGEDIVDPTGRTYRVLPSQVTTIKDHGFGLGHHARDRPDIVTKIQTKAANEKVGTDPRFLPKKVRLVGPDGEPIADEEEDEAAGEAGAGAGAGLGSGAGSGTASSSTLRSGGTGSLLKSGYIPRELSVLEKRMMKEARQRQRGNIVQKQVVWGKEYKGRAFLPEPECILFKDFVVGKAMRLRLVLTNVSYTFNSFKLLPLDDDIKDFFEFTFKPPGRMSAGMTCPILVTFTPKINQDINSELRLLASTGPVSIKLTCLTKKALPRIPDAVVDMGTVVLGEAKTQRLKIINDGALPVGFRVLRDEVEEAESKEKAGAEEAKGEGEEEEDPTLKLVASDDPEVTFNVDNRLDSYTTMTVPFSFRPQRPGPLFFNATIEFDNPACRPIVVTVKAKAIKVPIYVEKQVMDFKTCLFGKLYRMPLVLRNRGSIALKCLTEVPRGFRDGALEFNPTMGFVQARDKATGEPGRFELQMKFKPTPALFKRLGKHADKEKGRISVPIRVVAPDQVLPIIFTLTAKLTPSGLEFSPPSIDFGPCYTTQSVSVPLSVTNTSDLPVKFGFVKLDPQVDVQPRDGFGVLLPHETLTRDVIFTPSAATEENFKLTVMSTMNRVFRIPCHGQGVDCPLRMSQSLLKYRAMSVGEREVHNVYVTNTSARAQTFEFQVPYPELSQLKVSPCVETIGPGQTVRVEVEFTPKAEAAAAVEEVKGDDAAGQDGEGDAADAKVDEAKGDDAGEGEAAAEAAADSKEAAPAIKPEDIPAHVGKLTYSRKDVDGASGDASEELSTEPWSRHAMWKLPCFIRGANERRPEELRYSDALVLEVHTTTVRKTLEADQERVDFGQLAVGQAKVVSLRVRNLGERISKLSAGGLNPHGPFTIVNAMRSVMPGEYQDITLQFKPLRQRKFVETITVRSGIGMVNTVLTGEGVSPSLSMTPESGLLDLGHVLQNNTASEKFTLTNTSVFPLKFAIVLKTLAYSNYTPMEVFSCQPSEAVIPAGESQEVVVTFAPDHARSDSFVASFLVDIPNQETERLVTVRGRCWDRQLFVLPASTSDELPAEDPGMLVDGLAPPVAMAPTVAELEAEAKGEAADEGAGGGGGAGEAPAKYSLRLEFPKPDAGGYEGSDISLVKEVTVGSCVPNDSKLGSGGSFDVVWDSEDPSVAAGVFTVDTAKGSLNGGQTATLKFTFKPPEVEDRAAGAGNSVGQWIASTARVILRGGFCSPGVPDPQEVSVLLRGFVPL